MIFQEKIIIVQFDVTRCRTVFVIEENWLRYVKKDKLIISISNLFSVKINDRFKLRQIRERKIKERNKQTNKQTKRERERERERNKQTNKQTSKQRERERES